MFSHVLVGADDVAKSKKFYDAVFGTIGVPEGKVDPKGRVFYRTQTGTFGLTKPIDGKDCTFANGGTIGFACDGPEKVKDFRCRCRKRWQEHRGSTRLARGQGRQAVSRLST